MDTAFYFGSLNHLFGALVKILTMNKQVKKFYAPEIFDNSGDLNSRWYIFYYKPHPENSNKPLRVRIYGGLNYLQTAESRYIKANEIISKLKLNSPKLPTFFEKVFEYESLNWRKKTISAYKTVVKYYLEYLDKKSPEHATKQDLVEFFLKLHKKGTSKNTIEKYRSSLFTLYEKAITYDLVSINPVKKVKRTKRQPLSLMYFNDEQIDRLKESIELNAQLWLATQLIYYCFIRPGEQRLLKISDINFDSGYIEIRADISKNKKTEKVVIPSFLLEKLQYLKQYNNNYFVLSKTSVPGQEPVSEKWICDNHRKILNRLQIRGRYAFYSWKHTGVVKCVQSGMNIRDIQNQLRHHSLEMVMEYLKNLGVMQSIDLKYNFPSL